MGASRPPMQDVVLEDVGLEAGGLDAVEHAGPLHGPGRRFRARRWWWWVVAGGVAGAVAFSSVVIGLRNSADLAALGAVPGILAPLDGRVSEAWRSERARFADLAEVDGRLVGVENRPDGSVEIVALDPDTGEARWRVAARPPDALDTWATCAWPAAGPAEDPAGRAVGVCLVVDEAATHENAAGVWPYAVAARRLVIAATTGAVLSEAPTDPSTSFAALGTDLVTSRVDAGGRVHVARTDPLTGAERWTFTSRDPLPINTAGRQAATVTVVDGLVVVAGGSGWVLSGDGAVEHAWTAEPTAWDGGHVVVLGRGRALAETGTTAAGTSGTTVTDLTTARSFPHSGPVLSAMPDDGSLPGLVLAQPGGNGDLVALDVTSGRQRWAAAREDGDVAAGGLVVIDGRVVRAEEGGLRSIDGRNGSTLWIAPGTGSAQNALFTDGRVVLRAQLDPALGVVLAAYSLADGGRVWQTDIADDLQLFTVDGRLYGRSAQGLVALR